MEKILISKTENELSVNTCYKKEGQSLIDYYPYPHLFLENNRGPRPKSYYSLHYSPYPTPHSVRFRRSGGNVGILINDLT